MNRLVTGWYFKKMEELDGESNMGEMYDKVHGNNAWYGDWQNYLSKVKSSHTELWGFRPDLSTPKPIAVSSNGFFLQPWFN